MNGRRHADTNNPTGDVLHGLSIREPGKEWNSDEVGHRKSRFERMMSVDNCNAKMTVVFGIHITLWNTSVHQG